MKGYISVFNCSIQTTIAYRSTYYIGMITNLIYFIFLIYLWKEIFGNNQLISGFSWLEMKSYLLITFVLNTEVYSEHRLASKILNGSLAMDLLKPLRFQETTFASTFGSILLGLSFSVLFAASSVFFFEISYPRGVLVWWVLAVSTMNALIIKFLIIYLSSLLSFWTHHVTGLYWARTAVSNLFSGALIPIVFFPEWLQKAASYLPFQGIINTPTLIFLGKVELWDSLDMIGVQFIWIILLWLMGKGLFQIGLKKIVIHGG